jgi:hypothetical protein
VHIQRAGGAFGLLSKTGKVDYRESGCASHCQGWTRLLPVPFRTGSTLFSFDTIADCKLATTQGRGEVAKLFLRRSSAAAGCVATAVAVAPAGHRQEAPALRMCDGEKRNLRRRGPQPGLMRHFRMICGSSNRLPTRLLRKRGRNSVPASASRTRWLRPISGARQVHDPTARGPRKRPHPERFQFENRRRGLGLSDRLTRQSSSP